VARRRCSALLHTRSDFGMPCGWRRTGQERTTSRERARRPGSASTRLVRMMTSGSLHKDDGYDISIALAWNGLTKDGITRTLCRTAGRGGFRGTGPKVKWGDEILAERPHLVEVLAASWSPQAGEGQLRVALDDVQQKRDDLGHLLIGWLELVGGEHYELGQQWQRQRRRRRTSRPWTRQARE
jgi:hypothetical protein